MTKRAETPSNASKTALVTGASSGLGFEAAAQLAQEGFGRVIVTARTMEKAEIAVRALSKRTRMDVFRPAAVDLFDSNDCGRVGRSAA